MMYQPTAGHHQRLNIALVLSCSIAWLLAAINPHDPDAWALEQIATLLCVGLLLWAGRTVQFSPSAKLGLTTLFVLHAIGTHFTYSLTPYDEWWQTWFGSSLNQSFGWERNHYDRFVHFMFGLTTAKPFYESMRALLKISSNAAWFLAGHMVISVSAIYELMEWLAAIVFSGDSAALYLGSQGDIWDAQWDIALAIMGFSITCGNQVLAPNVTRLFHPHRAYQKKRVSRTADSKSQVSK